MEIDEKICLKPGAMLQGGKYKIEKILGQGGFGITYLAVQTGLNRKVAIKEFFMKEHCNRNTTTSGVSIGSEGSADIVKRYREKFVKEAQLIAGVEHKNIVRIIDTFEENNTAYYVMNYHANGSLQDYVENNEPLPEHKALFFIRQLCEALKYIHTNNILHLDVKPSNIMIDKEGNLVLIDFGISKHYDEGGKQTTSTPVGRSKGYAPFEQYIGGELKKFTPASDIYSAAATLLYMLTATRPPEPDEISEMKNDFPYQYFKGKGISNTTINAIAQGMKVNKSERPQTISEFEALLNNNANDNEIIAEIDDSDDTIPEPVKPTPKPTPAPKPQPTPTPKPNYTKYILGALVVALGVIVGIWLGNRETTPSEPTPEETVTVDTTAISQQAVAEYKKQEEQRLKEETERKQREEQARLIGQKRKQEEATKRSGKGTIAGHDYVDLGLSVKWATCNVGASQPHGYGNYYAWGETTTMSSYDNDNSRTYVKSMGDISGNASYDAARANWGGTWRLPTKREMEELNNKCTWQWTTQSGVNGYKVTGPNGNSIFLPAAGYCYGSSRNDVGEGGYYWSSTPDESNTYYAYFLYFSSGYHGVHWNYRYYGRTVRPVSE